MRKSIRITCLLALTLAFSGCGGSNRPPTREEGEEAVLTQVGELYRTYQMTKNKPPEKFADLASVRMMSGNGYESVRSGAVVLRYGAALPDTKEEPGQSSGDEVLAYAKEVPESGGKVLLINRTVKTMTADQFKAARLAGTAGPGTAQGKADAKPK